jgi:leader peptidase (prepilin peptidase)/N-methyltransferase
VTWVLVGILGLVLGSFFNVCIHRIPRGESIVNPPSHCPSCNRRISFYDNIPVLSWMLLKGRCRYCRKPISPRYLVVELLTAGLFVAAWARFGPGWELVRAMLLVSLLVVLALIDLEHMVIPFRLSVPGVALALGTALLPGIDLAGAFFGALAGVGFVLFGWLLWRYALARLFRRLGVDQKEGMGGGDLPFAALIGGFLGLGRTIAGLFVAVLLGVVVGLAMRWTGRTARGQEIPFGPFLAGGALVGLFFGRDIVDWYLRLLFGL